MQSDGLLPLLSVGRPAWIIHALRYKFRKVSPSAGQLRLAPAKCTPKPSLLQSMLTNMRQPHRHLCLPIAPVSNALVSNSPVPPPLVPGHSSRSRQSHAATDSPAATHHGLPPASRSEGVDAVENERLLWLEAFAAEFQTRPFAPAPQVPSAEYISLSCISRTYPPDIADDSQTGICPRAQLQF